MEKCQNYKILIFWDILDKRNEHLDQECVKRASTFQQKVIKEKNKLFFHSSVQGKIGAMLPDFPLKEDDSFF